MSSAVEEIEFSFTAGDRLASASVSTLAPSAAAAADLVATNLGSRGVGVREVVQGIGAPD